MKKLVTTAMILGLTLGGATFAEGAPSFDAVDTNKDGAITQNEASKVKGLDFAKADVDKDGILTPAEYKAAVG